MISMNFSACDISKGVLASPSFGATFRLHALSAAQRLRLAVRWLKIQIRQLETMKQRHNLLDGPSRNKKASASVTLRGLWPARFYVKIASFATRFSTQGVW